MTNIDTDRQVVRSGFRPDGNIQKRRPRRCRRLDMGHTNQHAANGRLYYLAPRLVLVPVEMGRGQGRLGSRRRMDAREGLDFRESPWATDALSTTLR